MGRRTGNWANGNLLWRPVGFVWPPSKGALATFKGLDCEATSLAEGPPMARAREGPKDLSAGAYICVRPFCAHRKVVYKLVRSYCRELPVC